MKRSSIIRFLALACVTALTLALPLSLAGCAKPLGKPVMTRGSDSITDAMYSYWLSTLKATFLYYYNGGTDDDTFWDTVLPTGETTAEYAAEVIDNEIRFYVIGMGLFRELGLTVPPAVSKEINDGIDELIAYWGRAALNEELAAYGINIDTLRDIRIIEAKLDAVYDALFGQNGARKPTADELEAYFAENYARVKFIQIYSGCNYLTDEAGVILTDDEGHYRTYELSEEEKAEKQRKIDEMMHDYADGASWESLTETYAETDISYYENGFHICSDSINVFGTTLVRAALEMQDGETRLVSDDCATYLVCRCLHIPYASLTEAYDLTQLSSLFERCAQEKYTAYFKSLAPEVLSDDAALAAFSLRTAPPNSRF